VCCACIGAGANSRCRACNGAPASFTLCSDDYQEILVGAHRVPCPYKAYGCRLYVSYLTADEHRRACPDMPCSCSEPAAGCDGGFLGSPRTLHGHLTGPLHSWPTTTIEYSKTHTIDVTERRHLLLSEGEGRVFVLAVAEDSAAGMTNVSLMCLRSRAAAAAGPHYKTRLWSHVPRDPVTGVEEQLQAEALVVSRGSPCEIAVGEGTILPLQPKFVLGAGSSRKIVLFVRIDKLKPIAAGRCILV
jgi:E3 ubiquitin-protein ligase SIAH1